MYGGLAPISCALFSYVSLTLATLTDLLPLVIVVAVLRSMAVATIDELAVDVGSMVLMLASLNQIHHPSNHHNQTDFPLSVPVKAPALALDPNRHHPQ